MLFLYASHQVGTTYGSFNTRQELSGTIGLCEVFPSRIQELLTQLDSSLKEAEALQLQLRSLEPAAPLSAVLAPLPAGSFEELDTGEQLAVQRLTELDHERTRLTDGLAANAAVWNELNAKLVQAGELLTLIGTQLNQLHPNCAEIRNAGFIESMRSQPASGILSEPFQAALREILDYLAQIHRIGSEIPDGDPEETLRRLQALQADPAAGSALPVPFAIQAAGPDTVLSPQAAGHYERMTAGAADSVQEIERQIAAQQAELDRFTEERLRLTKELEETKRKEEERLREEQARLKEEERLRLEKEQAGLHPAEEEAGEKSGEAGQGGDGKGGKPADDAGKADDHGGTEKPGGHDGSGDHTGGGDAGGNQPGGETGKADASKDAESGQSAGGPDTAGSGKDAGTEKPPKSSPSPSPSPSPSSSPAGDGSPAASSGHSPPGPGDPAAPEAKSQETDSHNNVTKPTDASGNISQEPAAAGQAPAKQPLAEHPSGNSPSSAAVPAAAGAPDEAQPKQSDTAQSKEATP